ncbi:MAG: hypothetical protein LRS43_02685, partial [Desulfurococcales archaeon]|nr:hypothetical protein [Desulfurococcales archaeon]
LCEDVSKEIGKIASRAPHRLLKVYIGSGPGFEAAAAGLASEGYDVRIVDERGTSGRRIGEVGVVRDKDLEASIKIAKLGVMDEERLPV